MIRFHTAFLFSYKFIVTIEKNLEQSNLLLSSNHESLVFLNRLE